LLSSILVHFTPVHISLTYFAKIHFDILLMCRPKLIFQRVLFPWDL
jgi:hypothetical protein